MKTREIQTIWTDWLAASDRLLHTLHEQTAALTLRDVARVETIQPELDQLITRLRDVDARAVDALGRLAESLNVETTMRSIVACLDKAEGQQVHGLANRVAISARNLDDVMAKNKKLLESEMTYINGTLTLIARAAVEAPIPRRPKSQSSVLVDVAA